MREGVILWRKEEAGEDSRRRVREGVREWRG